MSTIAGNGVAGFADGAAANAEFNYPDGVTVDASGNVYVADYNNNRIREVTTDGIATTVAGNGVAGYLNGTGINTEFNHPGGIVISKAGDFFISDERGNYIRKMTANNVVSLWAGNGTAGLVDGAADRAEFNDVRALCVDTAGNVFVPDYNNNKIRKITTASGGPLPISLLTFSAQLKNNSTLLAWQTATENNTNYFTILRSTDGNNFKSIGKVAAAGNSSTVKNYTYPDMSPSELNSNKVYYRLREVDIDGRGIYSDIQLVDFIKEHHIFSISPNPAKNYINIFSTQNVSNAQVEITDMNGKTLFNERQNFIAGQELRLSLSRFSNGVLIVTIINENNHEQFKIVKD